jgi:hypothetical protein
MLDLFQLFSLEFILSANAENLLVATYRYQDLQPANLPTRKMILDTTTLERLRRKAPTLESLYTLAWVTLAFHACDIESSNLFTHVQTLWGRNADCETETLVLVSLALQVHLTGINPFALS